ncbi:hypothetical protein [Streptomyces sp. NPDC001809]
MGDVEEVSRTGDPWSLSLSEALSAMTSPISNGRFGTRGTVTRS